MTDIALRECSGPDRATPWVVTWLTWPALFAVNMWAIVHAIAYEWNFGLTLGVLLAVGVATLLGLEFFFPLQRHWQMTWRSFFGRDVKYFAAGGITGGLTNFAIGLAGMTIAAGNQGPLSDWPLLVAVPASIFAFDFLQYWQHRWSHEADTPLKAFLWKTHVAHHLPEEVYLLMHPAGHPLNLILIQGVLRVPLFFVLGLSPEAVFAVTAIIGLQGLVSHCNVDLRAGWFNYVFVGTELHRFHHSADLSEGKNYAVALSVLDLIFGTFVYRPGEAPGRIGVAQTERYPQSREFWRVMAIPFRR